MTYTDIVHVRTRILVHKVHTTCVIRSIGSRFGCLHPLTSYRLYNTLCMPILRYGAELWTLTKVELTMLEQVHRKILCTILGLPVRCPSSSLSTLLGSSDIQTRILIHQLSIRLLVCESATNVAVNYLCLITC